MKVESSWLVSWLLRARASKSCLIRADFSCSNWVMRSLLSVTSCGTEQENGTQRRRKMLLRGDLWHLLCRGCWDVNPSRRPGPGRGSTGAPSPAATLSDPSRSVRTLSRPAFVTVFSLGQGCPIPAQGPSPSKQLDTAAWRQSSQYSLQTLLWGDQGWPS